jgi:hypothetical protein
MDLSNHRSPAHCRLEDRFPSYGLPLLPADAMQRAMVRLVARFHDMYYEPVYRRLYSQVSLKATGLPSVTHILFLRLCFSPHPSFAPAHALYGRVQQYNYNSPPHSLLRPFCTMHQHHTRGHRHCTRISPANYFLVAGQPCHAGCLCGVLSSEGTQGAHSPAGAAGHVSQQ